jgi:hypothetical protein
MEVANDSNEPMTGEAKTHPNPKEFVCPSGWGSMVNLHSELS